MILFSFFSVAHRGRFIDIKRVWKLKDAAPHGKTSLCVDKEVWGGECTLFHLYILFLHFILLLLCHRDSLVHHENP